MLRLRRPSGEARADVEVGVAAAMLDLRGIRLGEGCVSRGTSGRACLSLCAANTSSCCCCCGVGGILLLCCIIIVDVVVGKGGACFILNLFALLASVGLIVLAPSPLARPFEDMVLCLLFAFPEDGVTALALPSPLTLGLPSISPPRGGGCILRTLFARAWVFAVKVVGRGRDSGAVGMVVGWRVVARRGWLRLLVRERAGLREEWSMGVVGAMLFLDSRAPTATPL